MKPPRKSENELILGLVSVSDRASRGVYDDRGIPELEAWCRKAIINPMAVHKRLIPDERFEIEKTLRELVDIIGCDLVLTTGGTGPSRRDVTPEATLAVGTREMPGFGEQMRAISGRHSVAPDGRASRNARSCGAHHQSSRPAKGHC
mgnify:CR=1 FL=1